MHTHTYTGVFGKHPEYILITPRFRVAGRDRERRDLNRERVGRKREQRRRREGKAKEQVA